MGQGKGGAVATVGVCGLGGGADGVMPSMWVAWGTGVWAVWGAVGHRAFRRVSTGCGRIAGVGRAAGRLAERKRCKDPMFQ